MIERREEPKPVTSPCKYSRGRRSRRERRDCRLGDSFGGGSIPITESFLRWRRTLRNRLAFAYLQQVGLNEAVDVAVQNRIGVADLDAGPVVLYHAVGVEDVGTNLAAPGNLLLGLMKGLHSFLLLFQLKLVQPGAQDLHRHRLVFVLGALVLAGNHNIRGQMGDAHGRVGLVDTLPAGATGAVRVYAQLRLVDLYFDGLVDFRIDKDRGEGGMTARIGIEGRNTHQAVNTGLGLEIAVGIIAFYGKSDAF